jgi:hypothetical protein
MKYTYKKMAGGGSVKSEKGYTAKDRKAIRSLIEELADPHSVDVTGGSSVTVIKKPKKRMAAGGSVGPGGGMMGGSGSGGSARTAPSSGGRTTSSSAGGGRGPVGGRGRDSGRASANSPSSSPSSNASKGGGKYGADLSKSFGRNWADNTYTGRAFSAGARALGMKGYADGGIVGRPARSYRDMKAGAGSGVGRLQKTKIARGR